MKNILLFFTVIIGLVGCSNNTNGMPDNLIAQDKFIDVLTDVRLLEGAYSTKVSRPDTIRAKMDSHYQLLFEKHGIIKQDFFSSYDYYMNHKEDMLVIEDAAMEKLNKMSAEQSTLIPAKSKTDSVQVDSVRAIIKK